MLGDDRYEPISQSFGTLANDNEDELEIFKRFARDYIIHGKNRPTICAVNARVSLPYHNLEYASYYPSSGGGRSKPREVGTELVVTRRIVK